MNTIKFTSSSISSGYESYGSISNKKVTVFDSRIIDFSVLDQNGTTVLPPLKYDSSSNSTEIDLTDWNIIGEWTALKKTVQNGKDADQPIDSKDFFVRAFMLNANGLYICQKNFQKPIPMRRTQYIPLVGKKFYASGFSQLENGVSIIVTIPSTGTNTQYIGTARITRECLHHFQVEYDGQKILEAILDSEDFDENGENLGQIYYFPENLKAYDETTGKRKSYNWRCRISYKEIIDGSTEQWPNNLEWSEWSEYFTFKVNALPGSPTELSVKSN